MMRYLCSTLFILQSLALARSILHHYPKLELGPRDGGDAGSPLFLTPYVESGNITEGRRLARVPFTEGLHIESYAGFFTVNKTYDSNQFFWYFPAMVSNKKDAPVIVWLQGGPGETSLFGLFTENGPIGVQNMRFERRECNWALNNHIIYIDNPVGTGFSFTNDSKGYCTDETQVGEQLYSTMIQFFQLFPELQENKFFVTGESYGGKYAPALAYAIYKKNPTAHLKINLKGIAIGNGFSDPEHQLVYGKYLYQIGLIDWNQAKSLEEYEDICLNYLKNRKFVNATYTWHKLIYAINKVTGLSIYNYIDPKGDKEDFVSMVQKSSIRRDIHVGDLEFHSFVEVLNRMEEDFMKSVVPWISELLDHYEVVFYNGQVDIIVAYPLTVNFLRNLNFTGSDEYKTAKRKIWKVDGEVAGYVKCAGKLTEVMVRNAGHMVPTDQPKWALDLITRFTLQNNSNCQWS